MGGKHSELAAALDALDLTGQRLELAYCEGRAAKALGHAQVLRALAAKIEGLVLPEAHQEITRQTVPAASGKEGAHRVRMGPALCGKVV